MLASINYGQPLSPHPLNRGLFVRWQVLPQYAGTTIRDLFGRNPGTLTGVTWESSVGRQGGRGSTATAGGTSSIIDISTGVNMPCQSSATDPHTFSYWHRTTSYKSLSSPVSFGNQARTAAGTGVLRGILQFNNNYYCWGNSADWDTGVAYDVDSLWHHAAVTFDGSDRRFYRDGVLAAGPSNTGVSSFSTVGTYIEASTRHTAGESPVGNIDDIRMWSRCLSADEVWRVYSLSIRIDDPTLNWIDMTPRILNSVASAAGRSNQYLSLLGAA